MKIYHQPVGLIIETTGSQDALAKNKPGTNIKKQLHEAGICQHTAPINYSFIKHFYEESASKAGYHRQKQSTVQIRQKIYFCPSVARKTGKGRCEEIFRY